MMFMLENLKYRIIYYTHTLIIEKANPPQIAFKVTRITDTMAYCSYTQNADEIEEIIKKDIVTLFKKNMEKRLKEENGK